jgi:5-methylcytosine-specific restriction endonuclease McrA
MAFGAPRICACNRIVAYGAKCFCQIQRDKERKARAEQNRPNANARGYGRAWAIYRAAFLKKNPWCVRCGKPATVVDHIRPHRGDMKLFWDKLNHQALCAACHNSFKQSQEKRSADQRNGR